MPSVTALDSTIETQQVPIPLPFVYKDPLQIECVFIRINISNERNDN